MIHILDKMGVPYKVVNGQRVYTKYDKAGRSGPVICMIFNFMLRLVYVNFKSLLAFESGLLTTSRLEACAAA
ncbi:hypothetical protein F444_22793, partial [Phytophthora nicotianae P1976]